MLIVNLIKLIQLILSIKYSYSFRAFKNNQFTYYKAVNNVFDPSVAKETIDFHGIYVAGQTIYIELSAEVVISSKIYDAKVVNLNKYRLMFVQRNKPRILIAQEVILEMNYSGELSDSIIAFGDDEALHVPTIFNPNLTEPVHTWNYIELLYFDDRSRKVSVKRSLPWLKEDDWKFIKEWKMMDYIHFDNKLYLLIKRSIWNEKTTNITQEISIIRLCLDKGRELISTAIEIRYNRPEFQNDQITAAIFICLAYYVPEKIFLLITHKNPDQTLVHKRYFFNDFVSLFDKTGKECASGANNYTLMRDHLRSEDRSCQKTTYKSCSSNKNTVPSVELDFDQILDYHFIFAYGMSKNPPIEFAYNSTINGTHFCWKIVGRRWYCMKIHKNFNIDNSIQNVQAFFYGYPSGMFILAYNNKRYNESRLCEQHEFELLTCHKDYLLPMQDFQLRYYFNHRPFGFYRVDEDYRSITRLFYDHCTDYKSCIQCMMYGLNFDCIWSDSMCINDRKHNVTQTVNYC